MLKSIIYHLSFFNSRSDQRGQTILEVTVALAVASLVIAAAVIAVISSLSNEQFGINQNQATQLAQEGLDTIRNTSQSDWVNFSVLSGDYCLSGNGTLTARTGPICPENVGKLVREINLQDPPNDCVPSPTPPGGPINKKVTAVVRWSDPKCTGSSQYQYCHQVTLTSCFYKPKASGI